jgi:hypothetical protein
MYNKCAAILALVIMASVASPNELCSMVGRKS